MVLVPRDTNEPRQLVDRVHRDRDITIRRLVEAIGRTQVRAGDVGTTALRQSGPIEVETKLLDVQIEDRVEQIDVNSLSASSLIPRVERGQHTIDDVEPGGEIGNADGNPLWRVVGVAIEIPDTGHGLHEEILPGARNIGPRLTPA